VPATKTSGRRTAFMVIAGSGKRRRKWGAWKIEKKRVPGYLSYVGLFIWTNKA